MLLPQRPGVEVAQGGGAEVEPDDIYAPPAHLTPPKQRLHDGGPDAPRPPHDQVGKEEAAGRGVSLRRGGVGPKKH